MANGSMIGKSSIAQPLSVKHLVIIAGGKGTRLSSVAGDIPKVLVPVGEKPVLQHQLELAASAGIKTVTIFAGYLAHQIEDFVGDGAQFGLSIQVLIEKEPLGNAGAVLHSLDSLPEVFFVLYGDVMLALNFQRMAQSHVQQKADFTALVHPNDHPHDSDLIETDADNWVTATHAYPHVSDRYYCNLVNAGLYVVRREALRPWVSANGKSDFTKNLMRGLIAKGSRVLAYRSSEYAKDMGTPDRLLRVEADWKAGKIISDDVSRRRPTVFLDRDGTLNIEKGHLTNHTDLELIPGVGQVLKTLRQAGFQLVVLTNQPVIARGEATEADVVAIHHRLEWELGKQGAYLDGIYFCPHHPDSGYIGERKELKFQCRCRKPNKGLFERACLDLPVDIERSWMVGDQLRDVEMARRAGLRSVLVLTGPSEKDRHWDVKADYVADDLVAASSLILQHNTGVNAI